MNEDATPESLHIPVVEEIVTTSKVREVTGHVRLSKHVIEEPVHGSETLLTETVDIQRVPKNEFIENEPAPRHEGETLIIPVVEEIIEVRKRLVLREEIHIRKSQTAEPTDYSTNIKKERVEIERFAPPPDI